MNGGLDDLVADYLEKAETNGNSPFGKRSEEDPPEEGMTKEGAPIRPPPTAQPPSGAPGAPPMAGKPVAPAAPGDSPMGARPPAPGAAAPTPGAPPMGGRPPMPGQAPGVPPKPGMEADAPGGEAGKLPAPSIHEDQANLEAALSKVSHLGEKGFRSLHPDTQQELIADGYLDPQGNLTAAGHKEMVNYFAKHSANPNLGPQAQQKAQMRHQAHTEAAGQEASGHPAVHATWQQKQIEMRSGGMQPQQSGQAPGAPQAGPGMAAPRPPMGAPGMGSSRPPMGQGAPQMGGQGQRPMPPQGSIPGQPGPLGMAPRPPMGGPGARPPMPPGAPMGAPGARPPMPSAHGAPPAPQANAQPGAAPGKPMQPAKPMPPQFQKSMTGLDDLGDYLEKAYGGERSGHKYIRRTGAPGSYEYVYAHPKHGEYTVNAATHFKRERSAARKEGFGQLSLPMAEGGQRVGGMMPTFPTASGTGVDAAGAAAIKEDHAKRVEQNRKIMEGWKTQETPSAVDRVLRDLGYKQNERGEAVKPASSKDHAALSNEHLAARRRHDAEAINAENTRDLKGTKFHIAQAKQHQALMEHHAKRADEMRAVEAKPNMQAAEHNQTAHFLQNLGNLGVHVIKNPKGTHSFVGSVPADLAYERKDGTPLTEQDGKDIRQAGPGFVSHVRARTFATQEEAIAAAHKLGIGAKTPVPADKPAVSGKGEGSEGRSPAYEAARQRIHDVNEDFKNTPMTPETPGYDRAKAAALHQRAVSAHEEAARHAGKGAAAKNHTIMARQHQSLAVHHAAEAPYVAKDKAEMKAKREAKPAKLKTVKVHQGNTGNPAVEVPVKHSVGNMAVHANPNGPRYHVTHVPSGKFIASYPKLSDAKAAANAIHAAVPNAMSDLGFGEYPKKGHDSQVKKMSEALKAFNENKDAIKAPIKKSEGLSELGDYLRKSEALVGGLADGKSASDFDPKALAQGMRVEAEHSSNPKVQREIAQDHLTEDSNYYQKLARMEHSTEKSMSKTQGIDELGSYLAKSDGMPDSKDWDEIDKPVEQTLGGSPNGGDLTEHPVPESSGGEGAGDGVDAQGQVTGTPPGQPDLLGDDRPAEQQMTPGESAIEAAIPEGYKSMTPANQRSMVAKEHAQRVATLQKSHDVQVGGSVHPYSMQGTHGGSDAAAAELCKSEFYTGGEPTLAPPGAIIRQTVLCKSEGCGCKYPALLTACPSCGDGMVKSRMLPKGAYLGGDGNEAVRLEKAVFDPILKPAPEEADVHIPGPSPVMTLPAKAGSF